MTLVSPSRRVALQAAAGTAATLVVGFRFPAAAAPAPAGTPFEPNAWLRIHASGAVEVSISKTEMGQGTATGIAMIVAEELDADWSRVSVNTMLPDGKRFMITGGSYSIASSWEPARQAGAAARQMLLEAGAEALHAARSDCRTEAHAVVHAASGRRMVYGELVARAALRPVPAAPALKPVQDFRLIGRPLAAKNLPAIVRAQAVYGIDVRVPGMLFAVIERSPVINGRLAHLDARAARAVPGVVDVIRLRGNTFPAKLYLRDGAAVVARSTWAAMQGRRQLKTRWNEQGSERKPRSGRLASSASLAADFGRALDGAGDNPREGMHRWVSAARTGSEHGMAQAFETASRTLEFGYDVPLQAHAPMEPMNAVAHWTPDRCEVWAPCHFQSRLHNALRELTGLPAERVLLHTPLLGGSFGRRLEADYAMEAAMLSRELARPVQVLWTREDDIQHGLFSPPTRHRVRVALAADGRMLALEHAVAALSVRLQSEPESMAANGFDHTVVFDALKFPYAVDQLHVKHRLVEQAIRVLWWRRGYTPNHSFVNETVLDECAHAAGVDALQYRLRLLAPARVIQYDNEGEPELVDTGRLANVQRLACEAAGWGTALPAGIGRGLASTVTDSYVAQVLEVAVDGAALKVRRVVTAVDCGRVINPQLVKAQVEGSVVFALTAALKGAITVERGRVQQSNFHDYPLLRIDEMPIIETLLVDSAAAPTGIGEPASHPVAAALANAVFAATGQRLRSLPFRSPAA